jgi:hypothetical protein
VLSDISLALAPKEYKLSFIANYKLQWSGPWLPPAFFVCLALLPYSLLMHCFDILALLFLK